MTVDIAENQTENPFGVSKEFIQSTTKCAKEYITNLLDESLKQSFVVNQADPYRFGTRFFKAYTSYYKENIEDWKAVLPSVEYNIDTQIEVKYVGTVRKIYNFSLRFRDFFAMLYLGGEKNEYLCAHL